MAEDFNSMQGSLGLEMGPPTPSVTPTSPVPIPETKHPGQASVELAQQTRFEAEQTRQAVMPMTMPTGGIYNPAVAGMLPGGNPAAIFGAQYAQNMQAISAGYMNPYGASMYGMGPVPGFNAGMMPMAGGLTDPAYGVYRTRMPGGFGMPAYPGIPREPLIGGPFYQGLAAQMYTNPMDTAADLGMMRSAQYHGAAATVLSGAAQLGFGLAGGAIGTSLGTVAGAYLGGPVGAKIGGFVGGLAGGVIADSTVGRAAGEFLENNPVTNLAQRTAQIQAISGNFITGGPNVGMSGRGLDSTSAQDVARTLQKVGYAESTGFNAADLTKIFDQGSQAGLFDSVRDVSQIKSKVMSVAGTLKQFMELTNDADVTSAIKELGNMRTMGLSLGESITAAQNARMFARAAGTSLQAINAAGQSGGMTFQGQGLTAGLGMQMGSGAYASARQMVMAGTLNEEQLALQGGVPGIAQNITQSSLAMLKIPLLAGSVSKLGASGHFELDAEAVRDLSAGKLNLFDMAQRASSNMSAAIGKAGPSALGLYQAQETELQDQLGRQLGPVGMEVATMGLAEGLRRDMGLPQNAAGFTTAATILYGGDREQAHNLSQRALSADYFNQKLTSLRAEQNARDMQRRAGFEKSVAAGGAESDLYRSVGRPVSEAFGGIGDALSDAMAGVNRGITQYAEDTAALEMGARPYRFSPAAMAQTVAARTQVAALPAAAYLQNKELRDIMLGGGDTYEGLTPSAQAAYVDMQSGKGIGGFTGFMRQMGRIGVKSTDFDADAASFAAGARRNQEAAQATPEQMAASEQALLAKYGTQQRVSEVQNEYVQRYTQAANSAGRDDWNRFSFGLIGSSGRGAREEDFAFEREMGLDAGTASLVRRSVGGNLFSQLSESARRFMGTDTGTGVTTARRIAALSEAATEREEEMADELIGGSGSREVGAMRRLFDAPNANAAVVAGLLETAQSGDDDQRMQAFQALGGFMAEQGISASARDKTYVAAQQLQQSLRGQPGGAESLRDMSETALEFDGGLSAYARTFSSRVGEMRQYQQAAGAIGMRYAIEDQANPQYVAPLTAAFERGGTPAMLTQANALGGAAVFREGSAAYTRYDGAATDPTGFDRAIRAAAPLAQEGVLPGSPLDADIRNTRGLLENVSASLSPMQHLGGPGAEATPGSGSLSAADVGSFQQASSEMLKAAMLLQGRERESRHIDNLNMKMPQ